MENRTRTIWNIICGIGTILGIVDFGITHFNLNIKEMIQFLEQNMFSIIGVIGFILLVGLNIYWKVKDILDDHNIMIDMTMAIINLKHKTYIINLYRVEGESDEQAFKRLSSLGIFEIEEKKEILSIRQIMFDSFSGKYSTDEMRKCLELFYPNYSSTINIYEPNRTEQ